MNKFKFLFFIPFLGCNFSEASKLGIAVNSFIGLGKSGLKFDRKCLKIVRSQGDIEEDDDDKKGEGDYKDFSAVSFLFGGQADFECLQNDWFFGMEFGSIFNVAKYGLEGTSSITLAKKYQDKLKAFSLLAKNLDDEKVKELVDLYEQEKILNKKLDKIFKEDTSNLSEFDKIIFEPEYKEIEVDKLSKELRKEYDDFVLKKRKVIGFSSYKACKSLNDKINKLSPEELNKVHKKKYVVQNNRGPIFYCGPNVGWIVNEKLKFAISLDFVWHNIAIEPLGIPNIETFDKTFHGLMYKISAIYNIKDRVSVVCFAGYVQFFDATYDAPKKKKDSEDTENSLILQHKDMMLLGLGVNFKLK